MAMPLYSRTLTFRLRLEGVVYTVQGTCSMGRRRADCSVFHMILVFLGALLALTTDLTGGQDTAIHRPLPDIKQLLSDIQENQKRIESLVDQYSCTEDEEVRELNKDGRVKKTIVNLCVSV